MSDRFDPSRKPMPPTSTQSPTLDGLPKQFVKSLRTLFDILDDQNTGFVRLSEIEKRWSDDGKKGLPKGVIDSLRKVTPSNGLLSFERFCAGLKICLLRHQMESRNRTGPRPPENPQPTRPPSAPLLDVEEKQPQEKWDRNTINHNNMGQLRTLSMPQLPAETSSAFHVKPLYGPPKPPRTGLIDKTANQAERDKEIRTALQVWQLGVMKEEEARANSYQQGQNNRRPVSEPSAAEQPNGNNLTKKTVVNRRRDPRRYTVQNGIDYNLLTKMKQIEQEKNILMEGLQAVDKAKDWYLQRISALQEKIKFIGKTGQADQWSGSQEGRIELLRARISEINRHLASITDAGERGGLPLHINLAVSNVTPSHIFARLKQQNHLLTQEITKKNDRITSLEREKATLIRELIHTRAQRPRDQPSENDVFM